MATVTTIDVITRLSAPLDIEVDKGSTFRHEITWMAGEEGFETEVDLTGCTARMQLRESATSDTILHEMTTEDGGITLGGVNGTVEMFISDTASTLFTFRRAVYGLEIIFPISSDVRRLLRGTFTFFDETTR